MNIHVSNIKVETEDGDGGEVDVARGRFVSALMELLNKEDNSESENGSDSDTNKERSMQEFIDGSNSYRENAILPNSSRPVRKRRRKETELRDGGFHHTFVMRMFDRSVDLAQFEESSPLYPICRAWMLNQPHNSDLRVKQEPTSPYGNEFSRETDREKDNETKPVLPKITSLPLPEPWPKNSEPSNINPRIPKPLPQNIKKLGNINEESNVAPALLLTQHLRRWRTIRNQWKAVGQKADSRYHESYSILKAMFERDGEKAEIWNQDDRKENSEEAATGQLT